jgi:hypothetical protein
MGVGNRLADPTINTTRRQFGMNQQCLSKIKPEIRSQF